MSLLVNGIDPARHTYEDCEDMAEMLVATGRAVPAVKWCDDLADEAFRQANMRGLRDVV